MKQTGRDGPIHPSKIIDFYLSIGGTRAQAKEQIARLQRVEYWGNEIYSATVDRLAPQGFDDRMRCVHISFHRRDRAPCLDWRHAQQIKSDIVGPEIEAFQLHPAESRVVDTANEFHIWCLMKADGAPIGIPIGFPVGVRCDDPKFDGAVQRSTEELKP